MKTILVPTSGSETDRAVFATAIAAARPFGAHLEFLHICLTPGEAAPFVPHVDFARGAALHSAMRHIEVDQERRLATARRHFKELCENHSIPILETPERALGLTATWEEALDAPLERIVQRARHCDLVVLGRHSRPDGLPREFIESVLVEIGRPVLLAPSCAPEHVTGTVVVCWKETPEAARALSAALPLLAKSKRVVILSIEDPKKTSLQDGVDVVRHLAWHGVVAEARCVPSDGRTTAEQIETLASEYSADLLVMGGYGHGRVQELIFGGCTQHFLEHGERPILLMH
jgi:nucleotide-binding universal stress UspA family protein